VEFDVKAKFKQSDVTYAFEFGCHYKSSLLVFELSRPTATTPI